MTNKELIEYLKTMPENSEVEFFGYSRGHSFYERMRFEDIIEEKDKIIFIADWD